MSRSRFLTPISAIAAVAMLSAAAVLSPQPHGSAAEAAAAKAVTIKIVNMDFSPGVITVPVGSQVTWLNDDDDAHDIVADNNKSFRSKPLDTGDSYAFTFTQPGTYGFHCGIHPHMVGKIVVTP